MGRERELGWLLAAVREPPAVAVIHGEAGVGKSRLVRELAGVAGTGDLVLLVGHCHPSLQPFPLESVIGALGALGGVPAALPQTPLLGVLRPLLPEWAPQLPPEPWPVGDAGAQRHRTFRALRAVLEGLGPALCILEDLQWADPATLEFLVFLASAPPPALALVLTCRSQDGGPASPMPDTLWQALRPGVGTAISLPPLTPQDVCALVAGLPGSPPTSREFAAGLHAWTAGIPLAVEEVVGQLREEGGPDVFAGGAAAALARLPVPRLLSGPLLARLDGLGDDARLVTAAAAVIGRPAEERLLGVVAGLRPGAAATGLLEALAAGVLREQDAGAYGLRHPLAAQAAYQTIRGPRRRRLHERAAAALEQHDTPGAVGEIARHMREAGTPRWPYFAEAAAAEAAAAGDDRLAARLLEDALSAPDLPRAARIRMVLALGDAALYCASPCGAIRILQRTLEDEELAAGVRGEVRFSLSRLLGHAGDATGARAQAAQAVGELRARPGLAARAMINLAQPPWHCDSADHLGWLDRAVRTAGRQTDPVARIAVSSQRAAILLSLGDPEAWAAVREVPDAGDSPEERLQASRGYRSLAETSLGVGHYRQAELFLGEADRLHDAARNRSWGLWLDVSRTSLDWCHGRWDGLEGRLRNLLPEVAAMPGLRVGNQFVLGSLLLARGELDEARRLLSGALQAAADGQSLAQVITVSGRLARLHLQQGDPQAALETVAGALATIRSRQLWIAGRTVLPDAVQALLACGQHACARAVVGEFALGLRRRDAPAARAALAVCRGALAEADGRPGDAARHFGRADTGWRRLPNRYEAARARERRAGCTVGADRESARGLLHSTQQAYDELGAIGDAGRLWIPLKACGVSRGGRNSYGNGLSPREAQVAALAGSGLSNREIAETLCISPRTVEVHVAASLRKLRLRSRHELGQAGPPTKDT